MNQLIRSRVCDFERAADRIKNDWLNSKRLIHSTKSAVSFALLKWSATTFLPLPNLTLSDTAVILCRDFWSYFFYSSYSPCMMWWSACQMPSVPDSKAFAIEIADFIAERSLTNNLCFFKPISVRKAIATTFTCSSITWRGYERLKWSKVSCKSGRPQWSWA